MEQVKELNRLIENFSNIPETTPEEIEKKEKAYRILINSESLKRLKILADLQIMPFFLPKTETNKEFLVTDAQYHRYLRGEINIPADLEMKAIGISVTYSFFHWFLEFPEVFQKEGFDCILGNPPFLGGQKLSGSFGNNYLECIKYFFAPIGAVDLVTYFFRRDFNLLRNGGFQSLISTNTIAQGKARESGLDVICSKYGVINHAVRSMRWPGKAAVEVSLVTIHKGAWEKDFILDNKKVDRITPYLDDSEVLGNPFPLKQNSNKSFQGSIVLGKGFILTKEEAEKLINKDPRNKDVLYPYLNGDDLNNDPEQKASRWVINFFDWSEEKAKTYSDCFEIVERLVKQERQRWKLNENGDEILGTYALRKPLPQKWWIYGEKRPALYSTISKLDQVMAINRHTKHLLISIGEKDIVYSDATIVFALNTFHDFAILSSSIHEVWAWKNSSTMGASTLRYSAVNAFETFPFPEDASKNLDKLGYQLYLSRNHWMIKHQKGLTELQNLYHCNTDEANVQLKYIRSLCCDIDHVILDIYGWSDINLNHDFYEIDFLPENDCVRFSIQPDSRKEILKRLLLLNLKLHREEMDMKNRVKKQNKPKYSSQTNALFSMD